jgi:hypothetical protein
MIVSCPILASTFKMILDCGVFTLPSLNGGRYFALGHPEAETYRGLSATELHDAVMPTESAWYLTQ